MKIILNDEVKVKANEFDKIVLILKHHELVLIKKALEQYSDVDEENISKINYEVFDAHEFKNAASLKIKLIKMIQKIKDKLNEVMVY